MNMDRREFLGHTLALTAAGLSGSLFAESSQSSGWNDTLAQHRLASLEVRTVDLKWPRLVGKNARLDVHGRGMRETICLLHTDKGASGWGQFLAGRDRVEPLLARFKGAAIGDMFDPAIGITDVEARPMDLALHDLAGVILGVPVYEMLGNQGPRATACYSGMIYFDDLEPKENPAGIDKVLENCRRDIEYGYRQLKVKIGRGNRWMEREAGLRRDIEVTKQIAAAFPEIDILVDGNDGFDCDTFIRYLKGIGDVPLFWIEEPFRETRDDYRKLRAWLKANGRGKTLLADGEADPRHEFVMDLLKEGLLDVNLHDVGGHGFTAWRTLLKTLKQMGVTSSPHAWGTRLKTNYSAHLATGLGSVVTIEGVTCACDDVSFGDYRLEGGKLVTSAAPGFGMTLRV